MPGWVWGHSCWRIAAEHAIQRCPTGPEHAQMACTLPPAFPHLPCALYLLACERLLTPVALFPPSAAASPLTATDLPEFVADVRPHERDLHRGQGHRLRHSSTPTGTPSLVNMTTPYPPIWKEAVSRIGPTPRLRQPGPRGLDSQTAPQCHSHA